MVTSPYGLFYAGDDDVNEKLMRLRLYLSRDVTKLKESTAIGRSPAYVLVPRGEGSTAANVDGFREILTVEPRKPGWALLRRDESVGIP